MQCPFRKKITEEQRLGGTVITTEEFEECYKLNCMAYRHGEIGQFEYRGCARLDTPTTVEMK